MKLSQRDLIIQHLEIYSEITASVAKKQYGITRLNYYIKKLKQMGFNITSEKKIRKDRYGYEVHFMVYRLAEKKNDSGSDSAVNRQ